MRGGGGRVGGEGLSTAVGLHFLLITDRLDEQAWTYPTAAVGGAPAPAPLPPDFTSLCLTASSPNNRDAFPFCVLLHANLVTRSGFGQDTPH